MLARENTVVVLDFESTGPVAGFPDEPWQIGLVLLRGGRLDPDSFYESLLHVGPRPFNRYAPGRHAELRDALADAPPLATLWPRIRPILTAHPLCAHNTATEKRCLMRAYPLETFGPWIDTLKLARIAFPDLRSHRLEDLVARFALAPRLAALLPGRVPHDALYDAAACALLLETLLNLPGWKTVTTAQLVRARRAKPTPASG
jgi:DNA polymerase III subunit epsilon